ncbi:MAG: hypothetical protein JSS79_19575 [Bacteroidetes bacterium]|nr:hypothetical protein [Bacteroidota bacterium]
MSKKFKYRPQYALLILGLAGIVASFYLLPLFGLGEIGFSFLLSVFGVGTLMLTIVFLVLFARQLGLGYLKISDHQIEIPGYWSRRTILNLNEIKLIGATNTWDKVIKLSDGRQTYSIHGQLMRNVDLQELKLVLEEKLK